MKKHSIIKKKIKTYTKNFYKKIKFMHDVESIDLKFLIRSKYYEGSNIYTSEAAIDLAGTRYMFLSINDFNQSVHDVVTVLYENSFMRDNILARITMKEGKGVIMFDDNTDNITKRRHFFGPVDISKLHIRLIDEYGIPIDMMGIDWSFALEFQILYEK